MAQLGVDWVLAAALFKVASSLPVRLFDYITWMQRNAIDSEAFPIHRMSRRQEMTMPSDHVEGALKTGVGHLQDAAGGLVGDGDLQARGKLNEAAGFVRDKVGDLKDLTTEKFGRAQDQVGDLMTRARSRYGDAETLVSENPLIAVGIAAAIGIGVGLALRGRSHSTR